MKILLVSPYHGGSHEAWATGLSRFSQHEFYLLSLPARFWKWRMHGAAVTLARRFMESDWVPDLILATDMLDLSTFLALTRSRLAHTTAVLYMHENQLTYPLPKNKKNGPMRRQLGERDRHYAFINFTSMCAADAILFNSHYHLDTWFTALPKFLRHFPEYKELGSVQQLQTKSQVMPVGIDIEALTAVAVPPRTTKEQPLILWNQRWEYDKNPEQFFEAIHQLDQNHIPFQLALCGQKYGKRPKVFDQAIHQLKHRIIHVGHAPQTDYHRLLWQANITLSTAYHEFFGISIVEAIACQTFPLLPNRLSYPEIIPATHQEECLYNDPTTLQQKLEQAITTPHKTAQIAYTLSQNTKQFHWPNLAPKYDQFFSAAIR